MKSIQETHPSLKSEHYIEIGTYYPICECCLVDDVQENTTDKGVLKDILNNWKCNNEEIRKIINTLKFRLGLEEE